MSIINILYGAFAYVGNSDCRRFQQMKEPSRGELEFLVHTLSKLVGQYMERRGLLVRDMDNSYLTPRTVNSW